MNLQIIPGMIVNEPQFPKPVHEKANPRASRAYHLCKGFLTDIRDWSLVHTVFAEMSEEQQDASQSFLARVEKLVNQIRFVPNVPCQGG